MIKWRSLLGGGLISAVCLWLLLRTVDIGEARAALAAANPIWIGVSLLLIVCAVIVRCIRWQLLFLPDNQVSLWSTISSTMIGYMLNTVLPGRVGELARASLVSQTNRVGTARALGTIFVEKILDVLVLLLLLGTLTFFLPLPAEVTAVGVGAAVVFGVVAAAFFVLSLGRVRGRVVVWARRYLDRLPFAGRLRPSNMLDLVLGSADSLHRPRLLALHVVIAPGLWLLALLTVDAVMRAFSLELPWTAAALVLVLTNLGMTVPSAPGYVGVYHYIAVLALLPFGVDGAVAAAFAFALHALGFGSFLAAGVLIFLLGLARQHYSLRDLWRWRTPEPVPVSE